LVSVLSIEQIFFNFGEEKIHKMISKPVEVKAEKKYSLWVRFADGTSGAIDLSHLSHQGVFEKWEEEDLFFNPYIDKETDAVAWSQTLELSPDSLYLKLKGKTFEEWKSSVAHAAVK
jgi:hypothetical protein